MDFQAHLRIARVDRGDMVSLSEDGQSTDAGSEACVLSLITLSVGVNSIGGRHVNASASKRFDRSRLLMKVVALAL